MKRRGFIGFLAGLVGAPIAAQAASRPNWDKSAEWAKPVAPVASGRPEPIKPGSPMSSADFNARSDAIWDAHERLEGEYKALRETLARLGIKGPQ